MHEGAFPADHPLVITPIDTLQDSSIGQWDGHIWPLANHDQPVFSLRKSLRRPARPRGGGPALRQRGRCLPGSPRGADQQDQRQCGGAGGGDRDG